MLFLPILTPFSIIFLDIDNTVVYGNILAYTCNSVNIDPQRWHFLPWYTSNYSGRYVIQFSVLPQAKPNPVALSMPTHNASSNFSYTWCTVGSINVQSLVLAWGHLDLPQSSSSWRNFKVGPNVNPRGGNDCIPVENIRMSGNVTVHSSSEINVLMYAHNLRI